MLGAEREGAANPPGLVSAACLPGEAEAGHSLMVKGRG